MIKHQGKLLLLSILCFVPSSSLGEVPDDSVRKLLDLSGLTMQINQFPGLIKTGLEQAHQQGAAIPDAEFAAMLKSADESILPSEILEGIRISIKNSISEAQAKDVLAWYESDLGKQITAAEENASTPDAYQEMMQKAQSLLSDTERVAFAKRLDTLMSSTDMTMSIQEFSGLAVFSAIMTAMQPGVPLNVDPFKAQMAATRSQTRAAVEQMVVVSFVYSYQAIDLESLKKYEDFLSTPSATKFNKTVTDSMNREFSSAISKWADELAVVFKNNARPN